MLDAQDIATLTTIVTEQIRQSEDAIAADPNNCLIDGAKMWVKAMKQALHHLS